MTADKTFILILSPKEIFNETAIFLVNIAQHEQ